MHLAVCAHKVCWRSETSPTGYATDGGFPFQMAALSELFDRTTLLLPVVERPPVKGDSPLTGHRLSVVPLAPPAGKGITRKAAMPLWAAQVRATLVRGIRQADALHVCIPGDVGTVAMLIAQRMGKPLFVRHCGNWNYQRTAAERLWRWYVERYAGGRNVMLTTGGAPHPPSARNPAVRWVFSTSLRADDLAACAAPRQAPSAGEARLIIACRQEVAKGTGVVIEALPRILEQFPGAVLDVVGDGSALGQFRQMAAERGLNGRVVFHGNVDHPTVLRLMQAAHLFCFPTVASEGFPKAVLEALACGLPVVTTRVSVLPQLIGAGCGVVVDEVTPAAVAQATCQILEDADCYHAMADRAREVAARYSLERWRDTIGELLTASWGPLKHDG
ncbi:MAG: glycosyltransferase family 4 protein [Armatimonadetes bacterium]|jgi:glycosyltransferase involved in cell wall biosynthesis|nr:glycosyltransferase family 4 protein [Armatimonadota bacterium]